MNHTLLGQQPQAAPAAPGAEGANGPLGGPMMPFYFMAMVALFVVVVILPAQRRQKKELEKTIAGLKRGTKVVTSGGIVATIVTAKDGEDEIVIRSEDTRLRIKRSVVQHVLGSDEADAAKSQ